MAVDLKERRFKDKKHEGNINAENVVLREKTNSNSIIEVGGTAGVIGQVIFAVSVITLSNIACNKSYCGFAIPPNLEEFMDWNLWFSWRSAVIYFSFLFLQGLLAFIPWGGRCVNVPDSSATITANGLLILFINLILMVVLECFNIPIFYAIYKEYYALHVVSMFAAFLLCVYSYIKSRNVPNEKRNPYGNSGSLIYDFCMGRTVNTFYFNKINLKIVALRTSICACVIYNIVYLWLDTGLYNIPNPDFLQLETYRLVAGQILSMNPTLIAFVLLHILYLTYCLDSEKFINLTFEYNGEGTGLITILGYSLYPYAIKSIAKIILEHNIRLSSYTLISTAVFGLIGFYITYASNKEKYLFRTENSQGTHSRISYKDTIRTPNGKHLMVSGWWSVVRHPNYLGELIMHLSWAIPVLTLPPVIYSIGMVFYLMLRSSRDAERCHRKHGGAAWKEYCKRVPYAVIPGIY